MPEKEHYRKPEINCENLSFNPVEFHYTPMMNSDSIKKAKTTNGIEIYKKQRYNGKGVEEKKVLSYLKENEVSVEIPFKGGKSDEIITLGAGETLYDVFETLDKKQQDKIVEKLGIEIAKMHNAGIVHSDLDPVNITVNTSGNIALIDFEKKQSVPNLNEIDRSSVEEVIELFKDDIVCIADFPDITQLQRMKLIKAYMKEIYIQDPEIKKRLKAKIFESLFL